MQQDGLILELQNGNEKAFERIYELYSESVYGIIYSIVHDETIAEEIMQDVFLKIWENAASYNSSKGRFFTWILNIARNASIDQIRSKSHKNKQKNLAADNFVDILENKSHFSSTTDAIGISKYINVLKPICKKLIDLLFFKGFTQKETAEELEMPLGTVKTKNRACINKLREILAE
ncbi:MAG: sigma-70 family RNA polymerase sigma factor [Bacteroidota bacterium]|uniref:RNA polymerase sigma-70 factor n=1 Tax=Christiangramia flava JLT2011 TaxID=1229726 RepID=A0A1L7I8T5_9FLAO|nr:sigma-70 family RNA polymerase sigma factor [Christiangramia flava]APU69623.1 RNA polymerase sigma-70 factor [Christiangramia flava JLT2011]MAM18469.1 sigma-70 family RNA polymerase sigma factor [Christiangramia sp.]MEE2773171.1 sigma-70 family RNA polymerase sigma factor [Bacteroidota bacterium]OSS39346.1 RNA polymerase sigma-70 factor [Christiangramia flava JLT2011]|tara:strand:- start:16 stop:546 length:531 start_codon:yes stop_codon:yes gene_type:complete